uniref:U3 small nucleolar RNA-associated protein 15 C-terminal domain-containing protein n=1 Tax=Amorphochlora amoebiformis TaxID=1561963 RepID=A0A6T6Z4M3_9EUKA|mmetsp:Transcript_8473/g.13282  ORF Transcript_8473/g.13282 Transcript_8473/m.13282 type:complete len:529 (+) Transcript_8473:38-1624(+)
MEFTKTPLRRFPRNPIRKTTESRHWDKFKAVKTEKEVGRVSCISFSHTKPYDFLVASSTRVRIYNGRTCTPARTISRFKDVVHTAAFRNDGALIAASGDWPVVKVFETKSKGLLREFKGHRNPVHALRFLPGDTKIVSGSDDMTCRLWDIPSQEEIVRFEGHEDYVRCLTTSTTGLIVSGSYDHTVKAWDPRLKQSNNKTKDKSFEGRSTPSISKIKNSAFSINHGAPVEDVLMLGNGSMLVTAGDRHIKIWDIVAGGRLLATLSSQQKSVTCLAHSRSKHHNEPTLIAGSLDGQVRFYNLETFTVCHSMKLESPVLSVGVSPDQDYPVIACGLLDGTVAVRKMIGTNESKTDGVGFGSNLPRPGSKRYFMRGMTYKPESMAPNTLHVLNKRKKRFKPWDIHLRKFQYNRAMDAAIDSRNPVVLISLIDTLMLHDALRVALSGRDDTELVPILSFLVKHIINPLYSDTLTVVANVLIDLYGDVCRQSTLVDDMMVKLRDVVSEEIKIQESMFKVLGNMHLLTAYTSDE